MNSSRSIIAQELIDAGVIAVVRAPSPEPVLPLVEALLSGGVRAVEITMTTPQALAAIARVSREFADRALLGVGTVLNADTASAAIQSGARFVVTPILRPEIVPVAHTAGCPVMLGAYTPTEAQTAHETGADFVKIFPADGLGPAYVKALRAPLPHLRIVPTGGVDLQNLGGFIQAGCVAVGAGSSLVPNQALAHKDWPSITRLARAFVSELIRARGTPAA